MKRGNVFKGYKEGLISFLPTYKYDVGTDIYDTRYKTQIIYTCYLLHYCV